MDIEARLRTLEFRYRGVSSATAAAKANYIALAAAAAAGSTPLSIERAKSHWQTLDTLKRTIDAQMRKAETAEDATN